MTATLPIPVRFELPGEQWEPVTPESLGVTGAAFLAVRRGTSEVFAPTISVSGAWRNDEATLDEIADESLALLREQGGTDVELLKRRHVGTEHAPAIAQSMGALAQISGRTMDLRQAQAIQAVLDVEDPHRRVVLLYTLTCTFAQFEEMGEEFQRFVASVEVVPADAAETQA